MKTLNKSIAVAAALIFAYLMMIPAAHCGKVYIPKGTEISINYKIDLSTDLKDKPAGTEIFEIAADKTISGIKVIQQGGKVYCEITEFKKPGMLGGGGKIEIRIDSVSTALGHNIAVKPSILSGTGSNKKLKAILMLPLLGYGLLVKGDHAELARQGTSTTVITSELNSISF